MTLISIVLVTWNSQEALENCISSLFSRIPAKDFELFVVDNHSEDPAYLGAFGGFENVTIVRNSGNLGYAKAVNIGWKRASGKYFLVLNPDMIFLSNPFPRLIKEMKEHPEIGVIAPLLNDASGRPQIHGYYPAFPGILQYLLTRTLLAERIGFLRQLSNRYLHPKIGPSGVHHVDQIPGAFLFFHRNLFGRTPPLNEAYFIWMEDVDFCKRVHEMGLKVAVVADEKIIHIGGASFAKKSPLWKRRVSLESYLTYTRLYFSRWKYFFLKILLVIDSVARILLFAVFRIGKGRDQISAYVGFEMGILRAVLSR